MNNQAVICNQIIKNFGNGEDEVKALRGIDFEARLGEMTFLVGPSGCGKTTLLSVIAGLLNPSGGELQVLGTNLRQLHPAKAVEFRRQNLGFVFQQCNLLPSLTAAENAAVPLLAAGINRKIAVEKASASSPSLASGPVPTLIRINSQAASNSVLPSPGPSSTTPNSSSVMNPLLPSTQKPAITSWTSCAKSPSARIVPFWWSRMTAASSILQTASLT